MQTVLFHDEDAPVLEARAPSGEEPVLDLRRASHPARAHGPYAPTLPGGAVTEEVWAAPDRVTLLITGEVDAFDRNALVDWVTGCVAEGARHVVVDAREVEFADLDVVHTMARMRTNLERLGGTLDVIGLGRLWDIMLDLRFPASEREVDRALAAGAAS